MPTPPIFGDPMRVEDRIFLRVSRPIMASLKRIARERGERGHNSAARALILEGCLDGEVPTIVPGPYREPLNVTMTIEQREMVDQAIERESLRIGQQAEMSAYARRCLHRGIELYEENQRAGRRRAG